MKPLIKVLTSPFRSSKRKQSKKQSPEQIQQNNNNNPIDNLQTNVNMQNGITKDNLKFLDVYGQVEKMVDQLGNMLHFKDKLTESQKRELIYELSSIAIKEKTLGKTIFDEDVLEFDDDENHSQQKQQSQQHSQKQCNIPLSDVLTRSNTIQQSSSQSTLPDKQLQELFEYFECQESGNTQKNQPESDKPVKKSKQPNLSTFADIKSQMSKFWIKNSSKVFRLMKSNKSGKSMKQSLIVERQNIDPELKLKKKKKSLVGNLFSTWGVKKQQKTLNSTGPTSTVGSSNVIDDETNNNQKQTDQLYEQNEKQQTKIQFNF